MTVKARAPVWRRPKVVRGAMYGLLGLFALLALFLADWGKIQRNFAQPDILWEMLPNVLTIAARNTVVYTFAAFSFGFVLALVLALMKLSSIGLYRWFGGLRSASTKLSAHAPPASRSTSRRMSEIEWVSKSGKVVEPRWSGRSLTSNMLNSMSRRLLW